MFRALGDSEPQAESSRLRRVGLGGGTVRRTRSLSLNHDANHSTGSDRGKLAWPATVAHWQPEPEAASAGATGSASALNIVQ
jgi:hypothetical protein